MASKGGNQETARNAEHFGFYKETVKLAATGDEINLLKQRLGEDFVNERLDKTIDSIAQRIGSRSLALEDFARIQKHEYRQAHKLTSNRESAVFGWFMALTENGDLSNILELIDYHGLNNILDYYTAGIPFSVIDEMARNDISPAEALELLG